MTVLELDKTQQSSASRGAERFRVALGLFLIAAAALKLRDLAFDFGPRDSLVSSVPVEMTAAGIELILAAFLFARRALRFTWGGCLAFFLTAVSLNVSLAVRGQSCNCFGEVGRALGVNAWISLLVDLLFLAGTLICCPFGSSSKFSSAFVRRKALALSYAWPVLIAAALWLLLLAAGFVRFGSLPAARAFLHGHSLCPDSYHKDVGTVEIGKEAMVAFRMKNITPDTVTIIGVETNCGCALLNEDSLPLTISPGEERELVLCMMASGSVLETRFRHSATIFLDPPGPNLSVEFSGSIHTRYPHD